MAITSGVSSGKHNIRPDTCRRPVAVVVDCVVVVVVPPPEPLRQRWADCERIGAMAAVWNRRASNTACLAD